jgi:dihydropteroate synthase
MNPSRSASGAQRCHALMNRTKTVYQGIINVTPDSFSDGGLYCAPEHALAQAIKLIEQGAHILDIGGVSTRPGAAEIPPQAELQRVLPVLKTLRKNLSADVLISLDTSVPEVAHAAAAENLIDIINDVYSSRKIMQKDFQLPYARGSAITTAHVAAHFNLGLVEMHMQGTPSTMQLNPEYEDCVDDVVSFLRERVQFAHNCGVKWLAVDPGIGFGKTLEHNLQLMSEAGLRRLADLGVPVLVGLSRKSFLKMLAEAEGKLPRFDSKEAEILWRDQQSERWESNCIKWGARIIRTHLIKSVS